MIDGKICVLVLEDRATWYELQQLACEDSGALMLHGVDVPAALRLFEEYRDSIDTVVADSVIEVDGERDPKQGADFVRSLRRDHGYTGPIVSASREPNNNYLMVKCYGVTEGVEDKEEAVRRAIELAQESSA